MRRCAVAPESLRPLDNPACRTPHDPVPGQPPLSPFSGTVLYNWEYEGWCSGIIKHLGSSNCDPIRMPVHGKRKQLGGAVVNFEIFYERDGALARHVLRLGAYEPDGPFNSWVLLEATAKLSNPNPNPNNSNPNPNS